MRLPEPARGLWLRCANAVEAHLKENLTAYDGWTIGGGTILAARWGHRKSTDIDLKIPAGSGLDGIKHDIKPEASEDLARRVGELGAMEIDETGELQLIIKFKDGKIDIFEDEPAMKHGRSRMAVEHRTDWIFSNAQILAGKLERPGDLPVRDLFDMAVAGETDPTALEIALCGKTPAWRTKTLDSWREKGASYQVQAELTLEGVPERWAATGKDPVAAAAAEVEKRWYTAASLEVSGGRAAWRAECADGTVRTSECELTHGTTVDKWLHETGIERWAEARRDRAAANAAQEAREQCPEERPASPSSLANARSGGKPSRGSKR